MLHDVQGSLGPRGKSHIKTRSGGWGVEWCSGLLFVSQLILYLLGLKMNLSHFNKTRFLYLSIIYEDDLVIPGFSRKGVRIIGAQSERGADWGGVGHIRVLSPCFVRPDPLLRNLFTGVFSLGCRRPPTLRKIAVINLSAYKPRLGYRPIYL